MVLRTKHESDESRKRVHKTRRHRVQVCSADRHCQLLCRLHLRYFHDRGWLGSLVFGRLFDRAGIGILVPLTLISALFAPLVFFGGFGAVVLGSAI